MLSPQSIRGFLEISNNDYRKAEPLLCNANLRICMQKDLSLTSLLGSSMGITFNFILKLEPLLTSQHSQSFLEGFQVFHWKLLLTGPAILSLLLPSCQTEKTNNWEVVDSLSQSAIFPPPSIKTSSGRICSSLTRILQLKTLFLIYILQRVFSTPL